MVNEPLFPSKPLSNLTQDDLINYLFEQKKRGYAVFQDHKENSDIYELMLDDNHHLQFHQRKNKEVQVIGYELNNVYQYYNVNNMLELQQAVDRLANMAIGKNWQKSPTTSRLRSDKPATNCATISNLIGSASIEAIFDPYLENRSLITIKDILSFGDGRVANDVRVLSSDRKTSRSGPTLTKKGFDLWLDELNINGELRIMAKEEHRRFMLLSSGQSLLLGLSLNNINKNEAIHLESDILDKDFFNKIWAESIPLVQ